MAKKQRVKTCFDGAILLPSGVMNLLPCADAGQLKTFIYLCSGKPFDPDAAARTLGLSASELSCALEFCKGTGLFVFEDEPSTPLRQSQLYDSETLSKAISSTDFGCLKNAVEQMLGKVLNKNDISVLFQMFDFDGMPAEYICAVVSYAVKKGKGSIGYIRSTAYALYDQGIDTYDLLESYFERKNKSEDDCNRFRALCGFGNRSLSAKEKAYFTRWFDELAIPYELVTAAYEIMIDSIGCIKFAYMSKILEEWQENGYKTVEDTKKEKSKKSKPAGKAPVNDSFDIDEFFAAAVKKGMDT